MNRFSKFFSITVLTVTVLAVALIPFKAVSYGFLPPDDALRHAAKAISGKDWSQILVIRPDIKLDPHIGWHAALAFISKTMRWDAFELVLFSVIFLFILYSFTGIFSLRRPEAWTLTLLTMLLADRALTNRLFLGRPYLITMSALLLICFAWPRLKAKRPDYAIIMLLISAIAASTYVHCGWYFFALPVIAFFLAREWRAALTLTVVTVIGVIIGASLTGHPVEFLVQTIKHAYLAFNGAPGTNSLVIEFQPSMGSALIIVSALLLMVWRALRGRWNIKVIDNPVFILAVMSWMLGFITIRTWFDIGIPAVSCWIAGEFQDFLEENTGLLSLPRMFLAFAALFTLYIASTSDIGGKWSYRNFREYLNEGFPGQAGWLPERGGILYSPEMSIFYETFFRNPHAEWRYVLGFEPALMPPEDLQIYRDIQTHISDDKFKPWVDKMRPEDRMIFHYESSEPPKIKGLEWHRMTESIWSGRLPKASSDKVQ